MEALPEALLLIMRRWRSEGGPSQPAIAWPRERWAAYFPGHVDALWALPDLLDRQIVRQACEDAAADADAAERAFIVVMAWGYGGTVGYGPWRTHRVLSHTPGASNRLAAVAQTLSEAGALSAYRRLTADGDCTLRWLGPAFGTKYLYFCQPPGQERTALILDSLVASWLRRETDFDLNPVPWSIPTYRKYLEQMHRWASSLGCNADELEYAIFREMATQRNSQWA
jgi:hypothetical protein